MYAQKRTLIAAAGLLALTACSDASFLDSWTQEAGSFVDEGGFGNPTMTNQVAQTSEEAFLVDLNNRFSTEVTPMVNFAFDKTTLDDQAKAVLNEQANWIRQFPEVRFRVYGHTDLVGSDVYNKALGLRRANAVVDYLVSQGVERERLEAVVSFGETQPLIVTQDRERRNRRTVTEVTGVAKNYAGTLNGKYAAVIWRSYVASGSQFQSTQDADLGDIGG